MLAWGKKVGADFRQQVTEICQDLGIDPSWLMACMAFESGHTFSPSVRNAAGSGAVGLIQFMPPTLAALGTTPDKAAAMTATQQLGLVHQYFWPWRNKMHNLGDVYGVILWPAMVGLADSAVIFNMAAANHPKLYLQNKGLDFNHDGQITKGEIVARVQQELVAGLLPANAWDDLVA